MTSTRPYPDQATADAVAALVYRLRNRDPEDDDEGFAAEYVAALRSQGWRPTNARPAEPWDPRTRREQPPADGSTVHATVAEIRAQLDTARHTTTGEDANA